MPVLLSLAGAAAALCSSLGYRTGLLPLGAAFLLLLAGVVAAGLSLVFGVVGWWRGTQGMGLVPVASFIAAAAVVSGPATALIRGRGLPAIHDVTTDLDDPPQFVSVVALREDAPNTLVYEGAALAATQKAAYPDLQPLRLSSPVAEVLARSQALAHELGWQVVVVDPASGRLEATDTTSWFGFKDDVVIRLRPTDDGTLVDVRSVSRVGKGDLGANANRIRRFLARLKTSTASST